MSYERKIIDSSLLKPMLTNAPAGNPFYQQKIVFTGDLQGWERSAAALLAQKLGADVNTAISRRTNIVIIGKGAGPSKLEKIIDLIADGCNIQLMNERLFNLVIEQYKDFLNN